VFTFYHTEVFPSRLRVEKARIYVFTESFNLLELGKSLSAHQSEVFTFPPVDKGAGLSGEPFLFRTPVPILIRLIAAFRG